MAPLLRSPAAMEMTMLAVRHMQYMYLHRFAMWRDLEQASTNAQLCKGGTAHKRRSAHMPQRGGGAASSPKTNLGCSSRRRGKAGPAGQIERLCLFGALALPQLPPCKCTLACRCI